LHSNTVALLLLPALPEFNQSVLDFFNLDGSQIILTFDTAILTDYLNLVINEVQLWAVGTGSPKQEKGK